MELSAAVLLEGHAVDRDGWSASCGVVLLLSFVLFLLILGLHLLFELSSQSVLRDVLLMLLLIYV